MKLQSSMDQDFGKWQVEDLPLCIEYSLAVMEELRAYGEEGFQKIPHGGIEVGALLVGEHDGNTVRITEWRPMTCDHARGPGFALSPADREALAESIAKSVTSPELKGLIVVGWFHTHTRSRIFLSAEDLSLHEAFFNEPWQVALVTRPQKDQPPTAGFFCKDAAGNLNGEACAAEFVVKPDVAQSLKPKRATAAGAGPAGGAGRVLSGKPEGLSHTPEALSRHQRPMFRPMGEPRIHPSESSSPSHPRLAAQSIPDHSYAEPASLMAPPPATARVPAKWAALALFVVTALATGFHLWRTSQSAQAASLKVEELDQSLLISWDNTASSVATAERAVLRIVDGSTVRTVPLSMTAVRSGAVTYMRQADDVEVRLTLFHNDKPGAQVFARYVGASGSAPAANTTAGNAGPPPSLERLQLQSDVTRLREALRTESDRAARLREELALLEKTGGGAR